MIFCFPSIDISGFLGAERGVIWGSTGCGGPKQHQIADAGILLLKTRKKKLACQVLDIVRLTSAVVPYSLTRSMSPTNRDQQVVPPAQWIHRELYISDLGIFVLEGFDFDFWITTGARGLVL